MTDQQIEDARTWAKDDIAVGDDCPHAPRVVELADALIAMRGEVASIVVRLNAAVDFAKDFAKKHNDDFGYIDDLAAEVIARLRTIVAELEKP